MSQSNVDLNIGQSSKENNLEDFVVPRLPPIAGFWRRLFALILDYMLVGIAAMIITLPFSSFLFHTGPYGKFIGLLFQIPYFGIMNSRIGNGQTIGKRILKLAVRNKANRNISPALSFIRISILVIPTIFSISFDIKAIDWFFATISTGIGLAIILTYLFNRKSRQCLHDMVVGTYVIHIEDRRIHSYPVTDKKYWILSAVTVGLVGLLVLGSMFYSSNIKSNNSDIMTFVDNYSFKNSDFYAVNYSERTTFLGKNVQTKTLIIEVWYKGKATREIANEISQSIAYSMITNYGDSLKQYDALSVHIYSKYDIGIATSTFGFTNASTIEEWRNYFQENKITIDA